MLQIVLFAVHKKQKRQKKQKKQKKKEEMEVMMIEVMMWIGDWLLMETMMEVMAM